jgi:hypothetical protein
VRRVRFELAADLGDEDAEVVGLLAVVGAPDFLEEVPLADQPAGLADEELDQLPFGGVRRISLPLLVTCLAVRSTRKSGVCTTGVCSSVGVARRTAARRRASSSLIPNGLVT